MPLRIEQPITIHFPLEDGDELTFDFPEHGDPEFEKAKKQMRDGRSVQKGRKMKGQGAEVRGRLFDRFATNPTGPVLRGDGTRVDLSAVENWKQKLPGEIKESVIAQNFEESLTDEDEEDLTPASDEG